MMSSPLPEKARRASVAIAGAVDRHGSAMLMFSGGKESVVLADLAESVKSRITLVWVNTGNAFPHMVDFVRGYGARFKLEELKSNAPEYFLSHGLPSMIVPMQFHKASVRGELDNSDRVLINDWVSCCHEIRGKPAFDYIERSAATLVIHGQRRQDNAFPRLGSTETVAPLWDWSTEDVMNYVSERALELPKQYPDVLADASPSGGSMDCSLCTASLSAVRLRWVRKHAPIVFQQLRPMIRSVYSAVADEWQKVRPGMDEVESSEVGTEGGEQLAS